MIEVLIAGYVGAHNLGALELLNAFDNEYSLSTVGHTDVLFALSPFQDPGCLYDWGLAEKERSFLLAYSLRDFPDGQVWRDYCTDDTLVAQGIRDEGLHCWSWMSRLPRRCIPAVLS